MVFNGDVIVGVASISHLTLSTNQIQNSSQRGIRADGRSGGGLSQYACVNEEEKEVECMNECGGGVDMCA